MTDLDNKVLVTRLTVRGMNDSVAQDVDGFLDGNVSARTPEDEIIVLMANGVSDKTRPFASEILENMMSGNTTSTIKLLNHSAQLPQFVTEDFDLTDYVLVGMISITVATAVLFNSVVFQVLSGVKESQLKLKFLVQCSLLADILLALNFGVRFIPYILRIFSVDKLTAYICSQAASAVRGNFSAMCQGFAALALVFDRFCATCRPIAYYTSNYTKCHKAMFVLFIWGLPLSLVIPVFFLHPDVQQLVGEAPLCYYMYVGTSLSNLVHPAIIILSILLVVVVYISLWVYLYCKERPQNSTYSHLSVIGRSTTITCFMTYATYLILYTPLLLFYVLSKSEQNVIQGDNTKIGLVLLFLYLLNTVIDPVIFSVRMPSLRKKIGGLILGKKTESSALS